MGRPLGSKNKTKEEEKPVSIKRDPIFGYPIPEEPVKTNGCQSCQHEIEKHYGSPAKWCNAYGCQCKALR